MKKRKGKKSNYLAYFDMHKDTRKGESRLRWQARPLTNPSPGWGVKRLLFYSVLRVRGSPFPGDSEERVREQLSFLPTVDVLFPCVMSALCTIRLLILNEFID